MTLRGSSPSGWTIRMIRAFDGSRSKTPLLAERGEGRPVQQVPAGRAFGRLAVEIKRLIPSAKDGSRPRLCENSRVQFAPRKFFSIWTIHSGGWRPGDYPA